MLFAVFLLRILLFSAFTVFRTDRAARQRPAVPAENDLPQMIIPLFRLGRRGGPKARSHRFDLTQAAGAGAGYRPDKWRRLYQGLLTGAEIMLSTSAPLLFFGFLYCETADVLRVTFPGGRVRNSLRLRAVLWRVELCAAFMSITPAGKDA